MACAKVISQFEVMPVEDAVRRRHWSDEDKARIVEESFRGHRQGSTTARRYGISRSLLTRWRKAYRQGLLGRPGTPSFLAVQVAPEAAAPPTALAPTATSTGGPAERVEVTLTNGRRLSIGLSIDESALVCESAGNMDPLREWLKALKSLC